MTSTYKIWHWRYHTTVLRTVCRSYILQRPSPGASGVPRPVERTCWIRSQSPGFTSVRRPKLWSGKKWLLNQFLSIGMNKMVVPSTIFWSVKLFECLEMWFGGGEHLQTIWAIGVVRKPARQVSTPPGPEWIWLRLEPEFGKGFLGRTELPMVDVYRPILLFFFELSRYVDWTTRGKTFWTLACWPTYISNLEFQHINMLLQDFLETKALDFLANSPPRRFGRTVSRSFAVSFELSTPRRLRKAEFRSKSLFDQFLIAFRQQVLDALHLLLPSQPWFKLLITKLKNLRFKKRTCVGDDKVYKKTNISLCNPSLVVQPDKSQTIFSLSSKRWYRTDHKLLQNIYIPLGISMKHPTKIYKTKKKKEKKKTFQKPSKVQICQLSNHATIGSTPKTPRRRWFPHSTRLAPHSCHSGCPAFHPLAPWTKPCCSENGFCPNCWNMSYMSTFVQHFFKKYHGFVWAFDTL